MLTRNYHTHTWRCKHASGDCLHYATAAVHRGMEVLGFADHTPLPDGRWPEVRMAMEELEGYERAVRDAQVEHPELLVLMGMECEWAPEYGSFYRDELLGARSYDYLIGAIHYLRLDGEWRNAFQHAGGAQGLRAYVEQLIATIESDCFALIAHPDLFGCSNPVWNEDTAAASRDICQAAAQAGMPLELNAYGLRKPWIDTAAGRRAMYPWRPFWEIAAEAGVRVVLSSDAHRPQDVAHGAEELGELRDACGLQDIDLLQRIAERSG